MIGLPRGYCNDPVRREELRRMMVERNANGLLNTPEQRLAQSIHMKDLCDRGLINTPERRRAQSILMKDLIARGLINNPEQRRASSIKIKEMRNLGIIGTIEQYENLKGNQHSKGHKSSQKRIEMLMGNQYAKGYKHTPEQLIAMSGENAWNWQGGISLLPYCKKFDNEFREGVRCFYNHTCQVCGHVWQPGEARLAIHHLYANKESCCNEFDEGRYIYTLKPGGKSMQIEGDPNKFLAVCSSRNGCGCHSKLGGRNKKHLEQVKKYEKLINESFDGRSYYTHEELDAMKAAHITPPSYHSITSYENYDE